eukprot:TRINITY_DN8729_c0_g1_i1.p2 TRINITY_DN8729_c0_g1~~TRINITY_DN8729_c0_g1_i1.p2  ORF type:complete len:101 (+),score=3.52 TRINITY_DN8729_c0_g1_i1:169-471(+)
MTFSVHHSSNSTQVVTSCDHAHLPIVEFHMSSDFTSCNINNGRVIYMDVWVGITDRSCIVSDKVGNSPLCSSNLLNFAKLVLCFIICNSVNSKSSFNIVD